MPHFNSLKSTMKSKFFEFDLKLYLILFLSSIILILHSFYYLPFLSDDALISLQYAKRFLQGMGLTWTDGVPVEGYTNLLWILLISFFGVFKLDLIFITRFLGIGFNVAVLFIFVKTVEKINKSNKITFSPIIITALFYSFSGVIAVWSVGGLEQPILNFLFAMSFYFFIDLLHEKNISSKQVLKPGLFLGLMCLTRTDSFLFVLCFALIFLMGKFSKQNFFLSTLLVFPAIILLFGQLIFRIIYYHDIIPNPAYIKLGINNISIKYGIDYILKAFESMIPILFFAFFIFFCIKQLRIILLLLISLILWILYIIGIGGDIFPAYRHFNIIIVIISFLILIGINGFSTKLNTKRDVKYIIYSLLFVLLAFYLKSQVDNKMMKAAKGETWEWDGKEIALMLKKGFENQRPLIATSAAGCIPFWSDLPVIDTLGLNDYYIPRYSKRNVQDRRIGHGFGDGYYILAKNPDIVIFCGPWGSIGPCFTSEAQMYETQEFKKNYVPTIFKTITKNKKINSIMWINKNSQKIGVIKTENDIFIPAYLLNSSLRNYTYLCKDNKFRIKITKEYPAIFNDLEFDKNNYMIKTQPDILGMVEIKDIISGRIIAGKLPLKFNVDYSRFDIKIIPDKEDEIISIVIEKI